jgi:peptidylprolyl isomerase
VSKIIFAIIAIVVIVLYMRKTGADTKLADFNKEQGQTFLESNAKNVNVKTTDSGLQYEVMTEGAGTEHPKASDSVKVHYHGTLVDGTVFDSSVDRGEPISFGLNQVIKGWTEGVQLMVVGEKTKFTIPSDLGYGNRSAGAIPPGSVLIFEVELLGINE